MAQKTVTINVDSEHINAWLDTIKEGNDIMTKISDTCKSDDDRVLVYQDYLQQFTSEEFLKIIVNKQVEEAKAAAPTLSTPFNDRIETAQEAVKEDLKQAAEKAATVDQNDPPAPAEGADAAPAVAEPAPQ